jgi:hypothetical protein
VRRDTASVTPRNEEQTQRSLAAFGLGLTTELTPPGEWESQSLVAPALRLYLATAHTVAESWSGFDEVGWGGVIDGAPFVVERGRTGDHRFVHGADPSHAHQVRRSNQSNPTLAVHHLSADATLLQCAPYQPESPSWWRLVLDSVLFTASLLHDYEALHAGAVATADGVIAISAMSGGGKSTLVGELLCRGLTLMADDVLVLQPRVGEAPIAYPAPPLMTIPQASLPRLRATFPQARAAAICSIGQEDWIAVPVFPTPLPLTALVLLDRRPGVSTVLRRSSQPLAALIGALLRFPRTRAREQVRFELAAAIAEHVAIWELEADPSVDPGKLADLLLRRPGDGA